MGFKRPSRIQEVVLPILLSSPPRRIFVLSVNFSSDRFRLGNVIAQSQSATGKTSLICLAVLSRIDPRLNGPQAMVLLPTFELAVEVGSMIERMARFFPQIEVARAVRRTGAVGQPTLTRGELLEESIVVGTPGTV